MLCTIEGRQLRVTKQVYFFSPIIAKLTSHNPWHTLTADSDYSSKLENTVIISHFRVEKYFFLTIELLVSLDLIFNTKMVKNIRQGDSTVQYSTVRAE